MRPNRAKTALTAGVAVAALAVGLAACGSSSSGAQGDDVTVSDVWSRATAEQAETGAVYFTVESPDDDELVSASVPTEIAAAAQIHETTTNGESGSSTDMGDGEDMDMEDGEDGEDGDHSMSGDSSSGGMMGMRPVDSIALPAGQTVAFEPGGYHVMLVDLAGPLAEGETFDVTLTFRTAVSMTVTATVRS